MAQFRLSSIGTLSQTCQHNRLGYNSPKSHQENTKMLSGLKFTFDNLGPISHAELELGDLTIIAGRNNTGKTYMVYTMYGFLQNFEQYLNEYIEKTSFESDFERITSISLDDLASTIVKDGVASWSLDLESLNAIQTYLVQGAVRIYSNSEIPLIFQGPRTAFRSLRFDVETNPKPFYMLPMKHRMEEDSDLHIDLDELNFTASFYRSQPVEITMRGKKISLDELDEYYIERIKHYLKYSYVSALVAYQMSTRSPKYLLTSHRQSIALFLRDIDQSRNEIVRRFQTRDLARYLLDEIDNDEYLRLQPPNLLEETSWYSSPVQDNINLAREMPVIMSKNTPSFHIQLLDDIAEMLGGKYTAVNAQVRFVSINSNKSEFDIPLHLASSSVHELPLLYYILGYKYPLFLIIDEPESHLDTANQIQFARIIARLVNSGVKILITTHSDYIIKEFNNLIMANFLVDKQEQTVKDFGYSPDAAINPNFVKAYTAEGGGLVECDVDEYGIEMKVFDDTIDNINQRSNELAARIMMELEDE